MKIEQEQSSQIFNEIATFPFEIGMLLRFPKENPFLFNATL